LKEVTTEFLQHRHALMGFITGLLRDSDVAEDIFQEVWVRLASAVEKGIVIEDQARWCRGTARNLVLHHWRDQRNEKVIANSSLLEKIELAFEEDDRAASNWSERAEALRHCVQSLLRRAPPQDLPMSERLHELLDAWHDGALSEAEMREFEELLDDRQMRGQLVQDFVDRSLLATVIREEKLAAAAEEEPHRDDFREARFLGLRAWIQQFGLGGFGWRPAFAGAVLLVLVALGVFLAVNDFSKSDLPRLVEVQGVTLTRNGAAQTALQGEALRAGDMVQTTLNGGAELEFKDHTRVSLLGGTSLQVTESRAKHLLLEAGTVAVRAAKQVTNRPMEFRTAEAAAIVVGTQFELTARRGSTWLAVEEGRVHFLPKMAERQGVFVDAYQYSVAAADVDPAPQPFTGSPEQVRAAPVHIDWSMKSVRGDGSWKIENGEVEQGKVSAHPSYPTLWSTPDDPTSRIDLPVSISGDCLLESTVEVSAKPGDVPELQKWAAVAFRVGITDKLIKLHFIDNGARGKLLITFTETEPPRAGNDLITTESIPLLTASYRIKMCLVRTESGETKVSGKVWQASDPEPESWLVEANVPVHEMIHRVGLETTHCACTFRDFKASLLR
jgi:hypothetical protein